jgi:NAD(P)-dependent dehydrogenase (short-subunit alcohol dehydrogenase family)
MRRIWLTGASSGIGAALVRRLLADGHQLALTARRSAPMAALAEEFPGRVLLVPGDIEDASALATIAERIRQEWGALDLLVLNAGTCEYLEPGAFDTELVERLIRTNLLGTSRCLQAALPLLRAGEQAQVAVMCSAVTALALPRAGAYGASKAALRYLFESLRIDLAAENIAVTLISPGFVDTPLTRRNDFPMPQRWPAARAAAYIAERLPKRPLEIAFPLAFSLVIRTLGHLPAAWRLALGKRLARPPQEH